MIFAANFSFTTTQIGQNDHKEKLYIEIGQYTTTPELDGLATKKSQIVVIITASHCKTYYLSIFVGEIKICEKYAVSMQ